MSFGLALATFAVIAAAAGITPTHADEDAFMQYLTDRGYTARYATGKAVPRSSTITYGYYACQNLRESGSPGQVSMLPEFPLVAEAARHALCGHMFGFQPA